MSLRHSDDHVLARKEAFYNNTIAHHSSTRKRVCCRVYSRRAGACMRDAAPAAKLMVRQAHSALASAAHADATTALTSNEQLSANAARQFAVHLTARKTCTQVTEEIVHTCSRTAASSLRISRA